MQISPMQVALHHIAVTLSNINIDDLTDAEKLVLNELYQLGFVRFNAEKNEFETTDWH